MPSPQVFDRISQAADFIANETLRKRRQNEAQEIQQKRVDEERQFRMQESEKSRDFQREGDEKKAQASRLRNILSYSSKLDLTPESRQKLTTGILSDPNFNPDPAMLEEQTFTTTEKESPYFKTGTRLPISRISDIEKLTGRAGQSGDRTGAEITASSAINQTNRRLEAIERMIKKNPDDQNLIKRRKELQNRLGELTSIQDKQLGIPSQAERKTERIKLNSKTRLNDLQKQYDLGQINKDKYKNLVKEVYRQLGGNKEAEEFIANILNLE